MSPTRKPVAVVVGATSKWQADGRNTKLAHGKALDDSHLPVGIRWGIGGAIAQKFAKEGFFVVLTTRTAANAAGLGQAIEAQGGESMTVEMDLVSRKSISRAFATIREQVGDPHVLVYNAGYLEGSRSAAREGIAGAHPGRDVRDGAAHRQPRTVPGRQGGAARHAQARRRLLPHFQQLVLVAWTQAHDRAVAVLPSHNVRTLAQVLTEEYSEHGVHVANVVIDGLINSPGTHALSRAQKNPEIVMNPVKIAEAFYYLHTQDKSCWTHELQLTPFATKPSY